MDQILLIDKPAGITSHDVVDRVRRVFGTRQVGHAGTLDPFATGLLIIGVGAATKRLSEYVGMDKTYEATARLGATSSTFDPEG
ncbi:MAG: tRNA pseudouridine(55) synthase TruB, partial [Patescibacteria group bacterium]